MVDNGDTRRHALSFRRVTRPPARTANGERRTANGERRTANGERRTANGERRTANGEAFAACHTVIAAHVDFDAIARPSPCRAHHPVARVNRISVISDGTPKRFGGPQ